VEEIKREPHQGMEKILVWFSFYIKNARKKVREKI
jgi:hypothetical protein